VEVTNRLFGEPGVADACTAVLWVVEVNRKEVSITGVQETGSTYGERISGEEGDFEAFRWQRQGDR
jgi:hypothetical protein